MPHTIWREACRRLRDELPAKDYDTWIRPVCATRWSGRVLTLEVASGFAGKWLRDNLMSAIERAVADASGGPAAVTFAINRALDAPADRAGLPPRRAERAVPSGRAARFTFDSFVVGASNRLGYEAARAVCADPGVRYNPLVFYGRSRTRSPTSARSGRSPASPRRTSSTR